MNSHDKAVLERLAARLRVQFPPVRVFGFGSRVRGSADVHSDLDVCVVVPEVTPAVRRKISHAAWEVGLEADVLVSTVVFAADDFDRGPSSASPLVDTIRQEGVAA